MFEPSTCPPVTTFLENFGLEVQGQPYLGRQSTIGRSIIFNLVFGLSNSVRFYAKTFGLVHSQRKPTWGRHCQAFIEQIGLISTCLNVR